MSTATGGLRLPRAMMGCVPRLQLAHHRCRHPRHQQTPAVPATIVCIDSSLQRIPRYRSAGACASVPEAAGTHVRSLAAADFLVSGTRAQRNDALAGLLENAASVGRRRTVQVLIAAGAPCVRFGAPLDISNMVLANQATTLRLVLDAAAALRTPIDVDAPPASPPILGLRRDGARAVGVLLERGCNLRRHWLSSDEEDLGFAVAHFFSRDEPLALNAAARAIAAAAPAVLRAMLLHGLDPNASAAAADPVPLLSFALLVDGLTAFRRDESASSRRRCIDILLRAGANVLSRSVQGPDAVYYALQRSDADTLRKVLRAARSQCQQQAAGTASSVATTAAADAPDGGDAGTASLKAGFQQWLPLLAPIPDAISAAVLVDDARSPGASKLAPFAASADYAGRSLLFALTQRGEEDGAWADPARGVDDAMAVLLDEGMGVPLLAHPLDRDTPDRTFVHEVIAIMLDLTVSGGHGTGDVSQLVHQWLHTLELIRPHVPASVWHAAFETGVTPFALLENVALALEGMRGSAGAASGAGGRGKQRKKGAKAALFTPDVRDDLVRRVRALLESLPPASAAAAAAGAEGSSTGAGTGAALAPCDVSVTARDPRLSCGRGAYRTERNHACP